MCFLCCILHSSHSHVHATLAVCCVVWVDSPAAEAEEEEEEKKDAGKREKKKNSIHKRNKKHIKEKQREQTAEQRKPIMRTTIMIESMKSPTERTREI